MLMWKSSNLNKKVKNAIIVVAYNGSQGIYMLICVSCHSKTDTE